MEFFWLGATVQDKPSLLNGIQLGLNASMRPGSDFILSRGMFARRNLKRAMADAEDAAKVKISTPMLVRIAADVQSLQKTVVDSSIAAFPVKQQDAVLDIFARAAIAMDNNPADRDAILAALPEYALFVSNIMQGLGLIEEDQIKRANISNLVNSLFALSLCLAANNIIDWEARVRAIMLNMDPGGGWTLKNAGGKYFYPFNSKLRPGSGSIDAAGGRTQVAKEFDWKFKALADAFPMRILKLPLKALIGTNAPIRIDLMFAVNASFKTQVKKTNSPTIQVVKHHCTIEYGSLDANFTADWTAAVGPIENIIWDTDR